MNRPKAVGTAAETAVARYLIDHGFPTARRIALHGSGDVGDIHTTHVTWEIKAIISGTGRYTKWMRETETERRNAQRHLGILVVKPAGVGEANIDRWLAFTPLPTLENLLTQTALNPEPPATITSHGANYRMWLRAIQPIDTDPNQWRPTYLRVHPRATPDPADWWGVCHLHTMTRILHAAGYTDPEETTP